MKVRKFRIFRFQYGISAREIGEACGVSQQRISEIELNPEVWLREETRQRLWGGFDRLIRRRNEIDQEYQHCKATLFDAVEEVPNV